MGFQEPYDQDENKTFLERHRVLLSVVAIVVIGVGVTLMAKKTSSGGASRKGPELVSVRLPPPPPTPPPASTPPPPEMKQPEQKMIEQAPVNENEEKPDDKPPESAPVTTGIAGNGGADGFGLAGGKGNSLIGGNFNRQRSKWGWYAGMVQSGVGDALRRSPQWRTASASLTVRIWADSTGRVTRAKASGDAQLSQSVQDALTGFQLKEAPPAGMPMPIVMKITAKRPN